MQHVKATSGSPGEALPTFLVAARTDRGVVGVSDERLAEVVREFGFRGCLSTSAMEGWGVDQLREAVLASIDWTRIPPVTSTALFAAAKSFVLDQKAAGTLLTPLTSLLAAFIGAPITGLAAEAVPNAATGRDLCPVDETRVPLDDSAAAVSGAPDSVTIEMEASADAARSIAAASSIILGKEETTDFDVFLCHNGDDKPAVRWTAERLREHGILPWLDENELRPGRPWQEELEDKIGSIRSAAVFVGPSGIGPWQNQELRAFLREFTDRSCPVIPVLLPGAQTPSLPVFLQGMTWVDLRARDPGEIDRLVWGITGRKPAPSGSDQGCK